MIQPRKVSAPTNELPRGLVWYIIGQPKSGKTTALSKWSAKGVDGTLIIDIDLGADFVDGANVIPCTSLYPPVRTKVPKNPVVDGKPLFDKDGHDTDTQEIIPPEERGFFYRNGPDVGKPMPVYSLQEILAWLSDNLDTLPYTTVVIDTIDKVVGWYEQETFQHFGVTALGEVPFGADYGYLKERTLKMFNLFKTLFKKRGMDFVIVSHSKETTIVPAQGKKKAQKQLGPALGGAIATKLLGEADIIGYSRGEDSNGTYTISFEAYDEVKVGSRVRAIAQKELPFDYNVIAQTIAEYSEEEK